jgi:hypothetical protein
MNNTELSINYDLNNCRGFSRNYQLQYQSDINRGFGFDTGYNFRGQECKYSYDSNFYKEPIKMAKYISGSQICLTYPSKNHVASKCTNPFIQDNGVKIFRSINKVTDDFKQEYQHLNKKHKFGTIDYLGFQNCPGFCNNMDKTVCYMCFNLENNIEPGIYSFKWIWEFNPQEYYSTCWDAEIINNNQNKNDSIKNDDNNQNKNDSIKNDDNNQNKIDEPCKSRKLSEIFYRYTKETLCSKINTIPSESPSISPIPIIENTKKNCKIHQNTNKDTENTNSQNTNKDTENSNTKNTNIANPQNTNINSQNTNTANVWEQCGGNNIESKICKDSICIRYSPYYSQCLPNELEKNALCGQNDGKDINWMYNKCKSGLVCKAQLNSMDFRCY